MTIADWISNTFYNDVSILPVFFMMVGVGLAILGVSIFFHELGHWIYMKVKKGRNLRITFQFKNIFSFGWDAGTKADLVDLTDQEYNDYVMWGVLFGTLPILVSCYFWAPYFMLLIPYAAGSWHDIQIMIKLKEKLGDRDAD